MMKKEENREIKMVRQRNNTEKERRQRKRREKRGKIKEDRQVKKEGKERKRLVCFVGVDALFSFAFQLREPDRVSETKIKKPGGLS